MDPTILTTGLTLLLSDQTDVTSKAATRAQTAAAVLASQQADDKASHDSVASQAKIATDLTAYKAQLDAFFGPAAVPVVPVTPAS